MALHHCPYQCGVVSPELYAIELHVDDCPLNIDLSNPPVHSRPAPPDIDWIVCPRKDCGEHIQLHEIDQHHALHTASYFQDTDRVTDVSSTIYALFPENRLPVPIIPSLNDLFLTQPYVPEPLMTSLSTSPSPNDIPDAQVHNSSFN